MIKLHDLAEPETLRLRGGTDQATGVTANSSAAYDLAYLGGLIVGSVIGAFVSFFSATPYSVTEWKTGIVTEK